MPYWKQKSRSVVMAAQVSGMTSLACTDVDAGAPGEQCFVCGRCGGVVSTARRDAHEQLWCPAAQ